MRSIALLFTFAFIGRTARAAPPDAPVVLHAARVFDGDKLLGETWVTIERGHITAMAAARPSGPTVVLDLGNATLLPGLVDAHAHILLGEKDSIELGRLALLGESSAAKALNGLHAAQLLLAAGFTTIRDPGDFDLYRAHLDVRDAIDAGLFVGPRILAADRFITRTGGHYDDNWLAPEQHGGGWARVADGPQALVEAVRAEAKAGADWVKVAASGGFTTPRSNPDLPTFTDEEFRVVVNEAHRLHKKVAAHAHATAAVESSIRAGVDSIEHGSGATADQLREMARRHIAWVPTWYFDPPHSEPDAWLKAWRTGDAIKHARDQLKAAAAAGTMIVFGTESGVHAHGDGARQLALFVEAGMKPIDALRTATANATKMLGLDEVGRVARGFEADLVAVPGNPLTDIRTMEHVRFVMRSGHIVRNDP